MIPVDTSEQWREDWLSASVVNDVRVTDPTIRQPGFDLPRRSWSQLNHFRTVQLTQVESRFIRPLCVRGQQQTIMVNDSVQLSIYKVRRRTAFLHEVGDDAIHWLESTAVTALSLSLSLSLLRLTIVGS